MADDVDVGADGFGNRRDILGFALRLYGPASVVLCPRPRRSIAWTL
jgi:hypothetical protein